MSEIKKKIIETRDKIAEMPALAASIRNDIYKSLAAVQGLMYEAGNLEDLVENSKNQTSIAANGSYLTSSVNFFQHYEWVAAERNLLRGFLSTSPTQIANPFSYFENTVNIANSAAFFPQNEVIVTRDSVTSNQVKIKKDVNAQFGLGVKFLTTLYNPDSTYSFNLTSDVNDTITKIEPDGTSNTFSTYFGNYYLVASRDTGKLLGPADFEDLDAVIGPNVNLPLGSDFDFGHLDLNATGVDASIQLIKNQGSWNSKYRKININRVQTLSSTFPNGSSIGVNQTWQYPHLLEAEPLGENFNDSLIDGSKLGAGIKTAYLINQLSSFSNNSLTTATIKSAIRTLDGTGAIEKKIGFQEYAPTINSTLFVKRRIADFHGAEDSLFAIAVVVSPGTQVNTDWLPVGDNSGSFTDSDFSESAGASSQKMLTYSDEKFLVVLGSSWNGSANTIFGQSDKVSITGLDTAILKNGYSYTGTSDPSYDSSFGINPFVPAVESGDYGNIQPQMLGDVGRWHANIVRTANGEVNNYTTTSITATLYANDAFFGNYLNFSASNSSTADIYNFEVNQTAKFFKEPSNHLAVSVNGALSDSGSGTHPNRSKYSQTTFTHLGNLPFGRYSMNDTSANAATFAANHPESDYTKIRIYDNVRRMKNFLYDVYTSPNADLWDGFNWSVFNLFSFTNELTHPHDWTGKDFNTIVVPSESGGSYVGQPSTAGTSLGSIPVFTHNTLFNETNIRDSGNWWFTWHTTTSSSQSMNSMYFEVNARGLDFSNMVYPGGSYGSTPTGPTFKIYAGQGTDTRDSFYFSLPGSTANNFPTPPTNPAPPTSGTNSATKNFYHYVVTNDESGYVKWQRYKTVVTLTCTNHYTSSIPYWNVTFKLAKASPIVDGDPIIGAFMMNLVYSAIRGQNEIRLESGYSGGSITLGDHTTDSVTGNTTAPYGANDWGGNLGTWLKQYCKSMYCDSMLENPYDAFYLTKIAGNTNWNSLTGTDTPQYKYRNFANTMANTMVLESVGASNTYAATGGYNSGYNYPPETYTEAEVLSFKTGRSGVIQMGYGDASTLSNTFTLSLAAPSYPALNDPTNFTAETEIIVSSNLNFIPTALQLTQLQFRGNLKGAVEGIPGRYVASFYSGAYSGTYSGTYQGIYSAGFESIYSQGFDAAMYSAGYISYYSGTTGSYTPVYSDGAGNFYSGTPITDTNVYTAYYSSGYGDSFSAAVTVAYSSAFTTGAQYTGYYTGSYSTAYQGEGLFYQGTQTIYDEYLTVTLGKGGSSLSTLSFNIAGLNDGGVDSDVFVNSTFWDTYKSIYQSATDDFMDLVHTENGVTKLKISVKNSEYVDTRIGSMGSPWEVKLFVSGTRLDQEPGAEVFTLPYSTQRENSQTVGSKYEQTNNPRFTGYVNSYVWAEGGSGIMANVTHNTFSTWYTNDGSTEPLRYIAYHANNVVFGRYVGVYAYLRDPLVNILPMFSDRYDLVEHRIGHPVYEPKSLNAISSNTALNAKYFWDTRYVPGHKLDNYHLTNTSITANSFDISTKFANVTPYGTYTYNLINFNLEGNHPINDFNKKLEILTFPNEQLAEFRNFYEMLNGRLKQIYDDTDPT